MTISQQLQQCQTSIAQPLQPVFTEGVRQGVLCGNCCPQCPIWRRKCTCLQSKSKTTFGHKVPIERNFKESTYFILLSNLFQNERTSTPKGNHSYGPFFLEYSLLAEYNLLQKQKLPGVYVIPSSETSLSKSQETDISLEWHFD